MVRKAGLVLVGAALMLAACTPATPASPDPGLATSQPVQIPTPESTPTERDIEPSRNPYEAGAEADWAIDVDAPVLTIAFDRQTGRLVVVTKTDEREELRAFEVTSSGRTFESWTYELDEGHSVARIDAAQGRIFVNTADTQPTAETTESAEKPETSGQQPGDTADIEMSDVDDFLILSASRGTEIYRWSTSNPLDSAAPFIVGVFDDEVAVLKTDRDFLLAALLDDDGQLVDSQRMGSPEGEIRTGSIRGSIVEISRSGDSAQYVMFPSMSEIEGSRCFGVVDGAVCFKRDETAQAQAQEAQVEDAQATPITVVEYDMNGYPVRSTTAQPQSAATVYDVVGMNADTTVRELGAALLTGVETTEESAVPIRAVLADGEWLAQTQWPDNTSEPLPSEAPFGFLDSGALVNLATADVLTTDNPGMVGSGSASTMYFTFDGKTLTYLRPLG